MPPVPKPSFSKKPRKAMKKFNAKRKGHAFPGFVDEGLREFTRSLPCILAGRMMSRDSLLPHICWGEIRCCHVKSRGSGGEDRNNMYPGCDRAHQMQHYLGIPQFESLWSVKLKKIAQRVTAEYEKEKFPCPF